MRANKLAKAEYGKLFFRPAIYFMTAFLILALVILTFSFNPKTTRTDEFVSFDGTTVNEIYLNFSNPTSTNQNSKVKLDTQLENQYNLVHTFQTTESVYAKCQEKYEHLQTLESADGEFYRNLITFTNTPTDANKTNFINSLSALRTYVGQIKYFWETEIKDDTIDFFLSSENYNKLHAKISDFYSFIPNQLETKSISELITIGNTINEKYLFDDDLTLINSLKKIEIAPEIINDIESKYYSSIVSTTEGTLLANKFAEIENFASTNASSASDEDFLTINKLITEYKNITNIATSLLDSSLNINKTEGLSNKELKNFKGFENFNSYATDEKFALNNYLLENKIFDGNYLLNLSMAKISGFEATAFDFTVFAMQILGVILTIFCIFFVSSSIAGDIASGTMKMIAMRPFTRSEIIGGKILACIKFLILLLIISAVASFAVGYAMYGLGNVFNTILIFNASTVFELPVYIVLLIYLVGLFISILLFILLAGFLASITKSSTFAVFATFMIYLFNIILNATASTGTLFALLPFGSVDLFKYLGNASTTPGLLGINMIIDGNFYASAIYVALLGIVMLITSKLVFAKRDI